MVLLYQFSVHITGQDIDRELALPPGATTIGRDQSNTLVLPNALISRHHARIDCTGSDCTIIDLNSANGTFVNGQKIPVQVPILISDNALIKIGPIEIHLKAIEQEQKEEVSISVAAAEEEEEKPEANQEIEPVISISTGSLEPEPENPPLEPPPPPPPVFTPPPPKEIPIPPPGLAFTSTKLIEYLPGIYQQQFTSHFLALFESILFPIEWTVNNFDLYLDPGTSPADFLPWLMNWYFISLDPTWDEKQRRMLLKEAHQIYKRRGTPGSLSRILEIYLGVSATIIDDDEKLPPYTFKVKIPGSQTKVDQKLIERLINSNKPAYTMYTIEYTD